MSDGAALSAPMASRPIRVLHVMEATIGGTKRHLLDLVESIDKEAIQIEIASPRVRSLERVLFENTQDLRANKIVTFDLRDYPQLKKFKRVDLFPRSFKAGQEYIVSFNEDRDQAFVKLLKPDVFSGQKLIFALRD